LILAFVVATGIAATVEFVRHRRARRREQPARDVSTPD
jgi:hypothetical protein